MTAPSWARQMTLHDRQAYQLASREDLVKVLNRFRKLQESEFPEARTKAACAAEWNRKVA